MKECKFCHKEVKRPSHGYCVSCYQYFIMHGYDTWCPSEYGSLSRVEKEGSEQYGWPICHICGKAFTKLQQHIWYAHGMTKHEYCDKYGLDHKINMTEENYHNKMRDYAYANDMDKQVIEAGVKTRFEKGHDIRYERSFQTKVRLAGRGSELGEYSIRINKARREALDYIKSFDEAIQKQIIDTLNGPIEELSIDQLKLKCALLSYDLTKEVTI